MNQEGEKKRATLSAGLQQDCANATEECASVIETAVGLMRDAQQVTDSDSDELDAVEQRIAGAESSAAMLQAAIQAIEDAQEP